MDNNSAILGVAPAVLAILVEILNPVSEDVIKQQILHGKGRQIVRKCGDNEDDDINFDKDVENVAELVAKVAGAAVEIAALIPSWISVTSGLAAILLDITPNYWLSAISAWTALCAILGIKYFSRVNYELASNFAKKIPLLGLLVESKALSLIVVIANVTVIAGVTCVWWFHGSPPPTKS